MPYDFSARKIPTYTGINASPVEPTTAKAGNGSHLISQYNQALDDIQRTLDGIDSTVNYVYDTSTTTGQRVSELEFQITQPRPIEWTVIAENWSAVPGQRLILNAPLSAQNPVNVVLSNLFYFPGKYIELMNVGGAELDIKAGGSNYKGSPLPTRLYLPANSGQAITLIWISSEVGFVPTSNGILLEVA